MQKGLMIIGEMKGYEQTNRVYDPRGLCPTIPTNVGGYHEPKMIEIVAMRGREDGEQHLEPRKDKLTNTLTTVQKDNLILESDKVQSLSRAEQSRAEQSRAEQSRAEQSRAEQSRASAFGKLRRRERSA